MNKHHYTTLSNQKCSKCSKPLKLNLTEKKHQQDLLCYKCHRISQGKPPHHQPRLKRIKAKLPVHNHNPHEQEPLN